MFLPSTPNRDLVAHFLALANPTRLRMLQYLSQQGEMSVNELAIRLRMSQPRISWHLRMLRTGGVVASRREGRLRYCSVDMDSIRDRQRDLIRLLDPEPSAVGTGQAHSLGRD